MPNLYLINRTTNTISISGDDGDPRVSVPATVGSNNATVAIEKVKGNILLCDSLSALITGASLQVRYGSLTGSVLTATDMVAFKTGNPFDVEGGAITVQIAGVNLKDTTTDWTVTLPGDGTKRFMPQHYFFLCKTATALNADGTVNLGTAAAGTQLLNGQALTGLNLANEVFRVDVAVTAAATFADNATLYFEMASADTGTAGTMDVLIQGVFL